MKKLALFFTAVFLIGATVSATTTKTIDANFSITNFNKGYGNSFIFTEGGIEFSVFPDGQFDFYAPDYGPDVNVSVNSPNVSFSFNSGYDYNPYVQYDDFGAIIQVENTAIYYDYYGRVTQVGNVDINYNDYGRVARVGGLYVHYNNNRAFSYCSGYINVYNTTYVYRPWHIYYAIPAPSFCIVYASPYRQYYTPVRYQYYRPYTNNYREPVRYTQTRSNYTNGRRGTVTTTNRLSDRYRQTDNGSRSSVSSLRDNTRSSVANVDRGNSRTSTNTRAANTNRSNESIKNSNNRSATHSVTRENQGQRAVPSDRNARSASTRANPSESAVIAERNRRSNTQRNTSQNERPQVTDRKSMNRNTAAISRNTNTVKSIPNRKPQASNTRISSNTQQQRSSAQGSSSQRSSKQPSSRTNSRRGN